METIHSAQLTGLGGAHFPTYTKIQSAIKAGPGGTVVANAAEGEPGSSKDAALWFTNPHLVLDGLQLTAQLINATETIIWIHENATQQIQVIKAAINERTKTRRDTVPTRIITAPHKYVSGQTTSIINALHGGPAVPIQRRTGERAWGNGNPPVLVHNTETLARIATIAAGHSLTHTLTTWVTDQYRITVDAPLTATFQDLLPAGHTAPEAILLGGYTGTWIAWNTIANTPINETSLKKLGLTLGAGIIIPTKTNTCPLQQVAVIATWLAGESARQCGPCLYGTSDAASDITALAHGTLNRSGQKRLQQTLDLLPGRGGCALPDGTSHMIRSALATFAPEVTQHLAGTCSTVRTQKRSK
jgi:NADH:ubiquinone oxidoreductase subunit F (NADH-binding)